MKRYRGQAADQCRCYTRTRQIIRPMRRPALECDNNYSLAVTLSVADADSAERDLLPMTHINLFERKLSRLTILRDMPSISRYSIRCDVSCHH